MNTAEKVAPLDQIIIKIRRQNSEYVYSVQPQHLPREGNRNSLLWARNYGEPIAHKHLDVWFDADRWIRVLDPVKIEALENIPYVYDNF